MFALPITYALLCIIVFILITQSKRLQMDFIKHDSSCDDKNIFFQMAQGNFALFCTHAANMGEYFQHLVLILLVRLLFLHDLAHKKGVRLVM